MYRSINCPAVTGTEPDTLQLPLDAGEQVRAVLFNDPAVPTRKVTRIADDCCEYTSNRAAVQARGIHASTGAVSVELLFGLFTA